MFRPSTIGALALLALAGPAYARTLTVCPADARSRGCDFRGHLAIQAAVDRAKDGDIILVRAGRYSPAAHRDVPYKEITVRAYVLVDGKDVSIRGEAGAVLDGSRELPATAIAVRDADVRIENLEITGFRYDVQEDDFYEGHGIFVIDGRARIDGVTIRNFQKMGLVGRGASVIEASDLRIVDGHVGIWLRESSYLRLRECVVRGNDSSAIAAYGSSAVHVFNCAFDANLDDGIYADERAVIYVTNSLILRNVPIGANAAGESRIVLGYSALFGNEKDIGSKGKGEVLLGPEVLLADPLVDADYRPRAGSPLAGKGDPDVGSSVGPGAR